MQTLNTGSLFYATALCGAYLYMVASWGGYSFVINLLPIHCLASIVTGRLTSRLYVAYAPLVVLGTLAAACIPVVGFNALLTAEHFGSFLAFAVLHMAMAMRYFKVRAELVSALASCPSARRKQWGGRMRKGCAAVRGWIREIVGLCAPPLQPPCPLLHNTSTRMTLQQGILPAKTYAAAKTLMISSAVALVAVAITLSLGWIVASPTFRWTGASAHAVRCNLRWRAAC